MISTVSSTSNNRKTIPDKLGELFKISKTGKPGKMREVFPVREKSGNFRISPESQGIFYQSGKSQGKLDQKIILLFYIIYIILLFKTSCFQT